MNTVGSTVHPVFCQVLWTTSVNFPLANDHHVMLVANELTSHRLQHCYEKWPPHYGVGNR